MRIVDKMEPIHPDFDLIPVRENLKINYILAGSFVLVELYFLFVFFRNDVLSNGAFFAIVLWLIQMFTVMFLYLVTWILADKVLCNLKAESLVNACEDIEISAALEKYTAYRRYVLIRGVFDELKDTDVLGFSAGDRIIEYLKDGKKQTVHLPIEIPVFAVVQKDNGQPDDNGEVVFQNDCIEIHICFEQTN